MWRMRKLEARAPGFPPKPNHKLNSKHRWNGTRLTTRESEREGGREREREGEREGGREGERE